MATKRDYYSVLGVTRSATQDDIRRAHRKLARELHPDINKAPDAAKRFGEVQEAYDVLSDEQKRRQYDQLGHSAFVGGAGGAAGGPDPAARHGAHRTGTYTWSNIGGEPGGDFDPEDIGSIFEEFFGQRPGAAGVSGGGAAGARGGARRGPFRTRARSGPVRGRDAEHVITIPFDVALQGGHETLRVSRNSQAETIDVTIPKGVAEGAKLRLRGKGEPGADGGPAGDLLLEVRIAPHPEYRREGLDLLADVNVSIVEAALGAKVGVRTPRGEAQVTIPPGTPSGQRLRLKGMGVETADGRKGDFFAIVKIIPPRTLSEDDQAMLRALGERLPPVR